MFISLYIKSYGNKSMDTWILIFPVDYFDNDDVGDDEQDDSEWWWWW